MAIAENIIGTHYRYPDYFEVGREKIREFAEAVGEVADVEIAPDADAVVASTEGFRVADCERCGGILKPDITFFGEQVPRERVARAVALVEEAEALLVAGSSLTVYSGLRFVRQAAAADRPVVIVNRGTTRGDPLATVKVEAGTSETLTTFAELLPRSLETSRT